MLLVKCYQAHRPRDLGVLIGALLILSIDDALAKARQQRKRECKRTQRALELGVS